MRHGFAGLLSLVLIGFVAASAHAQSPTVQQQADAMATIAAVGQHVDVDGVSTVRPYLKPDGTLGLAVYAQGNAFQCSDNSPGLIDVLIDGVVHPEVAGGVLRFGRYDVQAWAVSAGACDLRHVNYYNGIGIVLDVTALKPGPHVVQFRVRNASGVFTDSPARAAMVFVRP